MKRDDVVRLAREAGFEVSGRNITWESVICTEELERFAAAMYAAGEEAKWQPIETAPTDGTVILGALKRSDVPVPVRFSEGYWRVSWDGYSLNRKFDGPTHWMPLPITPTNTEGEQGNG